VGTVAEVKRDPAQSLADVDVRPAAALDRARELMFVWLKPAASASAASSPAASSLAAPASAAPPPAAPASVRRPNAPSVPTKQPPAPASGANDE
jgi:hypothetical protein